MKILIADDQTRRYVRLIEKLVLLGVQRVDIHVVPSAIDARDKIGQNNYDLLVLDVMLPLWPENEPEVKNSLDLLFELHNDDSLKRPKKILGITADISLIAEAKQKFIDATWNVLEYSEFHDGWCNSIIASVAYLRNITVENHIQPVDVTVICALRNPEFEQVLKLPWKWAASEPIDDHTFIRRGMFTSNGVDFTVAAAFAPRMGMVASALLSSRLISALKPKLLVMCGICAGVSGKTEIGDVLVADPAWDFQSGKRVQDGSTSTLAIAPHQLNCTPRIRSHLEQIRDDARSLGELTMNFENAPRIPRLHLGPVASGSAVLADSNIVEDIKRQHRQLIGVEMEGYGMYAAANEATSPQPAYVSIKSVCDFADPHKGDDHQQFAAFTSAGVFRLLMERFGDRLLS
jgi:nucleoside phosphorylase/CheY-like chemotaxis protein